MKLVWFVAVYENHCQWKPKPGHITRGICTARKMTMVWTDHRWSRSGRVSRQENKSFSVVIIFLFYSFKKVWCGLKELTNEMHAVSYLNVTIHNSPCHSFKFSHPPFLLPSHPSFLTPIPSSLPPPFFLPSHPPCITPFFPSLPLFLSPVFFWWLLKKVSWILEAFFKKADWNNTT